MRRQHVGHNNKTISLGTNEPRALIVMLHKPKKNNRNGAMQGAQVMTGNVFQEKNGLER